MRGFLTTQRNYYKELIPLTKYRRATGLIMPCQDLYSIRSKRSVQPYTHEGRRGIENRLQDTIRTLRVYGYAI
jgi:hypothetical protein